MLTAIIIDDEAKAAKLLNSLVEHYCPDVTVTGITSNSLEGLDLVLSSRPDILFLDIEMPHLNGFELLDKMGDLTTHVIFTTAYNQYALKAIKIRALDYLLKPIDPADLIKAVKKASNLKSSKKEIEEKLESMISLIRSWR